VESQGVILPLHRSPGQRALAVLVAVVWSSGFVIFLLLAVYPESDLSRSRSALPLAVRVLIVAGVIGGGFFAVVMVPHPARAAVARGRIVVGSDGLTVDDPALFRRPTTIAWARITSLCIGPGVDSWLQRPTEGLSPPERQLSQFLDPPNLVLFFDVPIVIEDARGALNVHMYAGARPPHHSVPIVRLWGRVADAEAAFAAFRSSTVRATWVEEGIRPMDLGIVWLDAL
jgi:hypothetical protein